MKNLYSISMLIIKKRIPNMNIANRFLPTCSQSNGLGSLLPSPVDEIKQTLHYLSLVLRAYLFFFKPGTNFGLDFFYLESVKIKLSKQPITSNGIVKTAQIPGALTRS